MRIDTDAAAAGVAAAIAALLLLLLLLHIFNHELLRGREAPP